MEKERESDREGRGGRPAICERQFSPYFPIFWRLPPPFLSREARRRKGRGRHQHATREPSQPNKAKKGEACIEHSCGDSGQATSETCAWAGGPLLYVVVLPAARKRVQYDKTCFIIIRSRTCYDGAFVCSEPRAPERNRTERPVRGPLCLVQV